MSGPRVVVVGGGLAGVRAALSLADSGAQVTLLERRLRLGGLTWSFQRNGLSFDNGQHVFLRCCTAYLGFLDRIGARDAVHLQPRLDIPVLSPDGTRASIKRSSLRAPLHLASALARYRHLTWEQRLRLVWPAFALSRLNPEDPWLDTLTFGSWLSRHGQSDVAIDRLWNLITLPTLNVQASEASLALAVKVFRTGLLDQADGGDVGWSTVPLTELHGEYAARALDAAGVETLLGARVQHVVEHSDRGLEVVTDEHRHRADAVVVTTPPEVTQRVLPEGVLPTELGLGQSPIVNVHLVLDRQVTDLALAAVVNSPIQFFFDRTSSSGLQSGQCLSISLSAADDYISQSSSQLVGTFFAALQALLPIARTARLVDGVVTRERAATFRGTPGTAARRPSTRTAVPGLFLAGAWCATGWPATMEGAVLSGENAARAVLEDAEQANRQLQRVAP
jgi:squalene-associated FAD-dependent desaturase